MEQAYFNASQLLQWLSHIHTERNREQQSELYIKLSDYLTQIFHSWCNYTNPNLLYKVIELLSPYIEDNLFSSIMKPESLNFMHPFPFISLPAYVQKILASHKLDQIPQLYKTYEIVMDKRIIVLPTPQFFFFTFMSECCQSRQTQWYEHGSFLESIYSNPFLMLFTQYLQTLDEETVKYLTALAEEYLIKDPALGETAAPSRHMCEMLLFLVYILQRPANLLLPSYRMISVNPDALLLSLHGSFYRMFKAVCLSWQDGQNSYCSFVAEVWLQYLTPWKRSEILDGFLAVDYLQTPGRGKPEKPCTGEEAFWEEYIEANILIYTEIFSLMLRCLCSGMVFRLGDADLLLRIAETFDQDNEGYLFNGHLNLRLLRQWSKNGQLPFSIEKTLGAQLTNRSALYPFGDANLVNIAENLVHKVASHGFKEAFQIKKHWMALLGIRDRALEEGGESGQIRMRPNMKRSLLNSWDRPLRSDEWWILYIIAKYAAGVCDKLRKKDQWPPETDLRFFASYKNIAFCMLVAMIGFYLAR